MRLILIGPPGSGKGTQAALLSKKYGLPHVSTGEIYRKNIEQGTELGRKAKRYIDQGQLVSDALTIDMTLERLDQSDCKNGFILDGYPRTYTQALALDAYMSEHRFYPNIICNIDLPDESVIKRISGRRVCTGCKKNWHIDYDETKTPGICDECESPLMQREDDKPETVKARLAVYKKVSEPLLNHYRQKGMLTVVDGNRSVEEVFESIDQAIKRS